MFQGQAPEGGKSMDMFEQAPIACTLTAGDFKARIAAIADLNTRALGQATRDDLTIMLTYAPGAQAEVEAMVEAERACCAFLTFSTEIDDSEVRVRITAPEGAREAADTVFAPFLPGPSVAVGCGCCAGAAS